jgi:protein PhnA
MNEATNAIMIVGIHERCLKCAPKENIMDDETRDSNGTQLQDGDTVTLIKDLKVKGTSVTLKRGTVVKGIRLTGDPEEVECRVEKVKGLVLKTCVLKKA